MRVFASRQCADYACASYVGAGKARVVHVEVCCIGEAVWCL